MDYFVCHKKGSQLTKLLESGLETLKNAARAGGKILPPKVIIGVLYHDSCRSVYKRSLENENGRQEMRASYRNEFHIRLNCLNCD